MKHLHKHLLKTIELGIVGQSSDSPDQVPWVFYFRSDGRRFKETVQTYLHFLGVSSALPAKNNTQVAVTFVQVDEYNKSFYLFLNNQFLTYRGNSWKLCSM